MAGIRHSGESHKSIPVTQDIQPEKLAENLKGFSISNCSKNQKKSGGTRKKKQTETNTCKTKEKGTERPLSQASIRSKKYTSFQKSSDRAGKSGVNRLSSSDPSGDALLRKSTAGDQIRGLRHSSSSSPSQSSETAKFGAVQRKGRRSSDSCPEKGYLLPYGLRVQHAAHKCIWSGSESGSATSPAGSSSQPSGEYIAEVVSSKASISSDTKKGYECQFLGAERKQHHKTARKDFKFEAYMPLCEVQQSLKKGELIEGVLRINPRNYEDAYISAPDGQMDIYIGGTHDRNRALNGDVVAVQLKEPKDWKILWDELRDYQEKCHCEIFNSSDVENVQSNFSSTSSFSDVQQGKDKNDTNPASTFEIGVFSVISAQCEHFENTSSKKRREKKKNKKCKRKKKPVGFLDGDQKTKIDSVIASENKINSLSETVPKGNETLGYIPSRSVSDGNSYSSTSCDNSTLYNNQCDTKVRDVIELTVTADHPKNKEDTANELMNEHWSNSENTHLIVIPDDIPHFLSHKDNSITNSSSDTAVEEESRLETLGSIPVAPDELSGDEFSQSVSGDSTCSHHMEQLQEDKIYFALELDGINNNETDLYRNENEFHIIENIAEDEKDIITDVNNTLMETVTGSNTKVEISVTPNSSSCITASRNENENSLHSSVNEFLEDTTHILIELNKTSMKTVGTVNNTVEIAGTPNAFDLIADNMASSQHTEKDKENNEDNDCIISHRSIEHPALLKELHSDSLEDAATKCEKKINSKPQPKKISEPKGKEKLRYITELMNHPWGKKFIQKTAKVVHILEKKHTRMAAGSLKLLHDGSSKWALFSPTDHKLPRIFIPVRECPSDFLKHPKDFSNYLFLAKIIDWTEDSKFAKGNLIQKLGEIGEIEAETQGILLENGVDTKDFDEDVLKDLPSECDWHIPYEETQSRRDFRGECVFTIDPITARDLDDAVSCKKLDDGRTFEIGVHIADVTYFVKDGTSLDHIASERATSVYLVQNVVPMLPHTLCEKLCSLNPGEDRLSFSVVWKITDLGEIVEEWFGRSIIRSCAKLSYEDAQAIIENPQGDRDLTAFPHISGNFSIEDIVERVINLNSIAQKIRKMRFVNGALRLDQVKLQFCLDKETGMPSGFSIYEHRDSNRLIEEFMLLANMAVAHKIYKSFPDQALLRCHPPPDKKLMNDAVNLCEAMGIKLDASTSGTLQASLAALASDDVYSKAKVQALISLCSKPMKCAQYFSSGNFNDPNNYHHYALNVPLYTHFTSPIRRYPDIIVHRLLAASLDGVPANYTSELLEKLAHHCNDKKYTAKRVNELSCELFLVAFVRECGPMDDQAVVMGVMDHSFDVLMLSIGLVKRVYCDKLDLKSKHYQKEKGVPQLLLYWNRAEEFKQEIKMFTLVDISLYVENDDPMKINVVLRCPDLRSCER